MDVNKVLKEGQDILKKSNIDIREVRLLLALAMNLDLSNLISKKECNIEEYKKFIEYVSKRANHTPFAYLSGKKEFMKLSFNVTPAVLIPREETEILVEKVIELSKSLNKDKIKILDICTGSGIIAISLAKYIKKSKVVAVDISMDALKVAIENAKLNNVNVEFIQSDLFTNINYHDFDIIVSNPPYISKSEILNLQEEVKKEPIIALDGGEDGLNFYKNISFFAKDYLLEKGFLFFEIGYNQGDLVKEILLKNEFKNIMILKDLSNNNRVVIGEK